MQQKCTSTYGHDSLAQGWPDSCRWYSTQLNLKTHITTQYYTKILLIYCSLSVLICNIILGLGLGCTQLSKSGGWTASGYSSARSIKQCQWLPTREVDPYPQLFIASWSKQLIHQKFISNQSDLGAHQMHPTAPWLQGMSWRQECCNCGRWEQHWAFQEMHNLRSPFTNTVSLLYRL